MKKTILCVASLLSLYNVSFAQGDAECLIPNTTKQEKWEQYEQNRLQERTAWGRTKELLSELFADIKYLMPFDILLFKNNKIETEFAESLLKKYNLSLDDVTILHKDLRGFPMQPGFTIFNTVVLDQYEMAKFTQDEQAFMLAHEIAHLKQKHWAYKLALVCALFAMGKEFNGHSIGKNKLQNIVVSLLGVPLFCYISRRFELHADKEAAYALGSADGGISAFEKMRHKNTWRSDKTPNPNGIFHSLLSYFNMMFGQHPSLEQRIAMLEQHNKDIKES